MDGMGARIPGLGKNLFGFDDLVDLQVQRVLGVDHVDPRGPDAGHDQGATFQKGVTRERR